jgi:hypothetical protein
MEIETNATVIEDETLNEVKSPTVDDFVITALNRHERRKLTALGIAFKTVERTQYTNKNNTEFKQSKREIALQFGSKTGKLKKKHLDRKLRSEGLRED